MDPQIFQMKNGENMQIWEFNTYVENTEEFMETYMAHALDILNNEPINIFGWPLFLPVCIARDYYTLWTEERMQKIITAAKKKNIAIEINDMAHTPHDKFILKAKQAGLKFTFGSDSRNPNAGQACIIVKVLRKYAILKKKISLSRDQRDNFKKIKDKSKKTKVIMNPVSLPGVMGFYCFDVCELIPIGCLCFSGH